MTIYVLGDIHGYLGTLDRALALVEADGGLNAEVQFLGDYTDRGPDSRGVLDRLITGRDGGRNWHFVKGNHDRMFQLFLEAGEENDDHIGSGKSWLNRALGGTRTLGSYGVEGEAAAFMRNGGLETLTAYDIDGRTIPKGELTCRARAAVPDAHLAFLRDLPLFREVGPYLFVHAGIRPGVPLAEQAEDDLLWIRKGWLESEADHGPLVVHGHTALDFPAHYGNRINADSGAGYGNPLVPVVLEDGRAFTLDETGRTPLGPAA